MSMSMLLQFACLRACLQHLALIPFKMFNAIEDNLVSHPTTWIRKVIFGWGEKDGETSFLPQALLINSSSSLFFSLFVILPFPPEHGNQLKLLVKVMSYISSGDNVRFSWEQNIKGEVPLIHHLFSWVRFNTLVVMILVDMTKNYKNRNGYYY